MNNIYYSNMVTSKFTKAFRRPYSMAVWVSDKIKSGDRDEPINVLYLVDFYLSSLMFDKALLLDTDAGNWKFFIREGVQSAEMTMTWDSWFNMFCGDVGYDIASWWQVMDGLLVAMDRYDYQHEPDILVRHVQ